MLNAILNKGGMGVSISREETAERLNTLLRRHITLNHAYEYAIQKLNDANIVSRLNAFQKTARLNVSRLSETVLSNGAVPFSGVNVDPEDFTFPTGSVLTEILRMESDFLESVRDELKADHHIRTLAVLNNVRQASEDRSRYLSTL